MSHTDRSPDDERLLDRFLDGVLTGDELAGCRRRLEAEPAMRALLQTRRQLRRGFAAGREQVFSPAPGFAAQVIAAARRLPPVETAGGEVVAWCRRILLAAAVVVGASLLWRSGLFADQGDGTLQAAPDEVEDVIKALDARIRAGIGETERK